MEIQSETRCFDGSLKVITHRSEVLSCEMTFSLFLPPKPREEQPYLTFLSGLTCTHENFTTKAGAYGHAAKAGLAILAPDTSPRGEEVPDDAERYDFGKGAGFYLNATQQPWAKHYQMESYIHEELPALVEQRFALSAHKRGICGHSMGGHGALVHYLKYAGFYQSCSAFSPIVAPSQVPWGQQAFTSYLGENPQEWRAYDACALLVHKGAADNEILIDQGLADQFLTEQLQPERFEKVAQEAGQKLQLRRHEGYDHSYYFIQSFMGDHITHHAKLLGL